MMQFPARRPRTARGSTSSLYEEMAKELSRQSIEINCGMCGRRPTRIEYEIEVASCICWRTVELKYLCTVPDVGFRLTSTKSYINPSQTNWKKYEGSVSTAFQFYVKATIQAGIPKVADVSREYGCMQETSEEKLAASSDDSVVIVNEETDGLEQVQMTTRDQLMAVEEHAMVWDMQEQGVGCKRWWLERHKLLLQSRTARDQRDESEHNKDIMPLPCPDALLSLFDMSAGIVTSNDASWFSVMNPMTGALKRLPKTVAGEVFAVLRLLQLSRVGLCVGVSLGVRRGWQVPHEPEPPRITGCFFRGYSRARDAWAFWHFKSLPPLPAEGGSDDAGSVYGRLDPFMYRSKLMAAGIVVVGKHAGGVPFARPCFAPKWMVIVEAADEEADEQRLEWTIVSSIDVRGLCRNVEPHHLLPCKRANNMLFLHLLDRPVAFNLDTRAWHLHVPRWNVNREESVWNVAYVPSLTAPPDNDGRDSNLGIGLPNYLEIIPSTAGKILPPFWCDQKQFVEDFLKVLDYYARTL
ncbi:hypothetical protein SELMODRAFT_430422 [Selaginella moellendorffii]|uniref:Uncharacterized protein n=1 Tax=Selaginella moellendorffii TaxID=88036 RepID=D8T9D1_SELML|nr:hypothetical protein SELMODRAFT_430422 [Selaginella moellendorffii]